MKSHPVMLSAIQPSNLLTLGNYLGAIRNWVQLQNQYDCIFFAVDQHAITVRQDPAALREQTYYAIATYLAAGLDPDHCTLFVQSHVPQHAELGWALTCNTYMGELSRMTQYKDKSAQQEQNIPVGLFVYPVLMAADILLYQTELVPVGADQKQHVELTRDLAIRMNNVYGEGLFVVPKPHIAEVGARIMSLQDPTSKMSKSDPNPNASVFLTDTDKQIEAKIKRAVTDSGSEITVDPDQKPGVFNLLQIQACWTGKTPAALAQSYAGKMYGHLKVDTAQIVIEGLRPLRQKTQEFMNDRGQLDQILKKGAEKARARAQTTLDRVYDRMGFLPRPA